GGPADPRSPVLDLLLDDHARRGDARERGTEVPRTGPDEVPELRSVGAEVGLRGGSWLLLRSDVLDGALVVARAEPGDDSLGPAGVLRRRRDEDGVPEGDREVAPVGQRG